MAVEREFQYFQRIILYFQTTHCVFFVANSINHIENYANVKPNACLRT